MKIPENKEKIEIRSTFLLEVRIGRGIFIPTKPRSRSVGKSLILSGNLAKMYIIII